MLQLADFLKTEYEKVVLNDFLQLKNKTILITGGNGLIGSNILSYLQYLNKKENLNIKFLVHSFSKPVMWIPKDSNITYYQSDLNKDLENWDFDYLIHTATYGQPKKFMENKLGTIKLNTETYIKLLEMAKKKGAKVLFMSSSEIYGEIPAEVLPANENFNGNVCTLSPRAIYAEAKRLGETISKLYIEQGVDVKIIRLAIGYGPGVRLSDSKVMNEFVRKALTYREINMMDAGEAIRHYGFITDIVEMILNVFLSGSESLYNVGGEDIKSIAELADEIGQITGSVVKKPKVNHNVHSAPQNIVLDITKYKKEFNKRNFVSFKDGLSLLINWMKLLEEWGNS